MKRAARWGIGLAVLVAAGRVGADTWTNAAGDTLEAEAVECDGRTVLFRRPGGQEVRLPLFSLSGNEQRRVQERLNGPLLPADVRPAFDQAALQLERARLLLSEQQLDNQEYAARHDQVIRTFVKACAALSHAENSDEVRQWVERLEAR
ncbi:MAG TPA: hypothetical protein P5567_12665 [Kiritimatiellia bacterium]|nr:hypothetical protein [Kiritimatiellia bacterium]HRZ13294.1 hypothetical protein [Kiritimatiellia bacterium]HSA18743.1 hypothetical protein [Kiritimatiellia bacterium]